MTKGTKSLRQVLAGVVLGILLLPLSLILEFEYSRWYQRRLRRTFPRGIVFRSDPNGRDLARRPVFLFCR